MTGWCDEGCETGWTGYMCNKGNYKWQYKSYIGQYEANIFKCRLAPVQ